MPIISSFYEAGAAPVGTSFSFGALTLAGAGALDAPAGATAITNAGGTNLVLSGGKVSPDTGGGVTSGTVVFDSAVEWTITAAANEYSVITDVEAHAAMQAAAPAGGVTVRFQPGQRTIGTQRVGNGITFTNRVTLTGSESTVISPRLEVGSVHNLTISGLNIHTVTNDGLFAGCVTQHGPGKNLIIEDCILSGPFVDGFADLSASGSYHSNLSAFSNKSSGGLLEGLIFRRNLVQDVGLGMKPQMVGSSAWEVTDNLFRKLYTDAAGFIVGDAAFLTAPKIFSRNVFMESLADSTDADNPHADFFQINHSSFSFQQNIEGLVMEQNVYIETPTLSRGKGVQGLVSFSSTVIKDAIIRGNIILTSSAHGITLEEIQGGLIEGNTLVNDDPANPGNSPKLILGTDGSGATGTITIARNVTTGYTLGPVGDATFNNVDNIDIGGGGSIIPHTDAFVGPTFIPESLAEVLAKYALKPFGPLDIDNSGDQSVGDVGAINSAFATFGEPRDPSGWSIVA